MDGTVIDIGDFSIFFVERGKGIPVLYVHGNLGSCRWYERVMDVAGARAIALDIPNFGRSKPLPDEPDIDRYADAVLAFIRKLDLDRPVLVGHSLGGAVALSLAARFPRLIRGLVLVDSAAPSGLVTPKDRYPLFEMWRTNRAVLSQALRTIVPTLADDAFFQSFVDDAMRMAAPAWVGHAEALSRFDYRGRTAAFTGPVLVVWGRKDVVITEAIARETAAAFPDAKLEIFEEVGHSVMAENPKLFISIIEGFIRDRRLAS
jgi:branched-chain amino acid transport system permease protein